jgi:hypothetical protein
MHLSTHCLHGAIATCWLISSPSPISGIGYYAPDILATLVGMYCVCNWMVYVCYKVHLHWPSYPKVRWLYSQAIYHTLNQCFSRPSIESCISAHYNTHIYQSDTCIDPRYIHQVILNCSSSLVWINVRVCSSSLSSYDHNARQYLFRLPYCPLRYSLAFDHTIECYSMVMLLIYDLKLALIES